MKAGLTELSKRVPGRKLAAIGFASAEAWFGYTLTSIVLGLYPGRTRHIT